MPFVTFQGVGSASAPISVRAERVVAVIGIEGCGPSQIHVEGGGDSFAVRENPEIVRAKLSHALGDPDMETIEKG